MKILYDNCDIPLERYIRVVVDGDYTALIIDPEAEREPISQELFDAAWQAINIEFSGLIESPEAAATYATIERICELQAKVMRVKMLVQAARMYPSDTILEALQDLDYGLDLDRYDPKAFVADLERMLIEIKAEEIEIQQLQAQIERAKDDNKPSAQFTRQYFDDMIVAFEDLMKKDYDVTTLSLRKYASLVRALQRKIQHERRHGRGK